MSAVLLDVLPAMVDAPDGTTWRRARAAVVSTDGAADGTGAVSAELRVWQLRGRSAVLVAQRPLEGPVADDLASALPTGSIGPLTLYDADGPWRIWRSRVGCG